MPAQAWVTYAAGFNTTLAMLADVAANPGYSLAVHNGEMLRGLPQQPRLSRRSYVVCAIAATFPARC